MKKLIAIILVLIGYSSFGQTPPRTGYLVQTAKWKFVNPVWLDSGAYITKIVKTSGQNRYLVYDSLTGKIGYRYVSVDFSNYVPYTGAIADVDLGTYKLNAQSIHAKGTGGNGHLGLKHQSSSATASANETVIFANSGGYLYSKNDGNAIEKIIGSNDTAAMLSKYVRKADTLHMTYTSPLKRQGNDLSIPVATGSVNGYLSSSDWTTFNSKVDSTDLVSLFVTCRNNTGSLITKGSTVYITGAIGQTPTIALARANSETTSFNIGVAAFDIPINTQVQNNVTTAGLIENLNTSAFNDGDKLYLSSSTAGGVQNTPPASPNFGIFIGYVLHAHINQGKILVNLEKTLISQNTTIDSSLISVPSNNVVKTNLDLKLNKTDTIAFTFSRGLKRSANTIRLDTSKSYLFTSGMKFSGLSNTFGQNRVAVIDSVTGAINYKYISGGTTYTGGNGIIVGGSVIYRDSLKTTGQYGNTWENGMYLGSSNNSSMVFRTNNLQAMTLDSNQRLGIGTRFPVSRLHIPIAPTATARYGLFSLSNTTTAFNGITAGHFGGSATGTYLAINQLGTTNANFIDFQKKGVSQWKVDSVGSQSSGSLTILTNIAQKGSIRVALSAANSNSYAQVCLGAGSFAGGGGGAWSGSANGTYIGINSTDGGDFITAQNSGVTAYQVDGSGNMYVGGFVYTSGYYSFLSSSKISNSSNGVIKLTDNAATDFNRLQLGGTTSSYPSLARNGAALASMLADNSGLARFLVKDTVFSSVWNGKIDVPTKNAVYDQMILKVNYTDTATMLSKYLRSADTLKLHNQVAARVKYSDTASMLSPYVLESQVYSGTWTPTLTDLGNCGTLTARTSYYTRTGNVVVCGGMLTLNVTTISTPTSFSMSLPISTNFTDAFQSGGSGIGFNTNMETFQVQSEPTLDKVVFQTASCTNTNSGTEVSFQFTYKIN